MLEPSVLPMIRFHRTTVHRAKAQLWGDILTFRNWGWVSCLKEISGLSFHTPSGTGIEALEHGKSELLAIVHELCMTL